MSLGLALGLAHGISYGIFMQNPTLGFVLGVAIGVPLGRRLQAYYEQLNAARAVARHSGHGAGENHFLVIADRAPM